MKKIPIKFIKEKSILNKKTKSFLNSKFIFKKKFLKKPEWMKIRLPNNFEKIQKIKNILRKHNLNTVCEEASCPNLSECFHNETATFMILGNICTRKCSFCDVQYGRPSLINEKEPKNIANAIKEMKLKYIVITSVNRDDLKDGGAQHFSKCIYMIRKKIPNIKIEILVPDFRKCMKYAIKVLSTTPPNVFNHNLESIPRLYKIIRPGANYFASLKLLKEFKILHPNIPTKSGLMLGVGETKKEILDVLKDLRDHNVTMLTLGQYLQPTKYHLPVDRYVDIFEFNEMKKKAISMGFTHVASGPFVRSSYHADLQMKNTF